MRYFATFRRGQPLADYYVEVPADDARSAYELMMLMYTSHWHSLVPEDEKPNRIDARGLRHAKWGLLNCEVS